MHLPSSKSILGSVALSLIIGTAACSSGGAADESGSTAQAATTSTDLFDTLTQTLNGAHGARDFATVTHHPDTVLYSAAYVPDETTDPKFKANPLDNPLIQSLVTMINDTPSGANIHMAHFHFDLPVVYDALLAAINRGVGVKLVKSDNGDGTKSLAGGPSLANQLATAMSALPKTNAGKDFDFVHPCEHKATSTDPGACIGEHLMHNKFVLFSKLCKSGLDAKGNCNAGGFYGGVSAQMSVNLDDTNPYCFNTLSVFGGDNVSEDAAASAGFNHLYTTYRDYFDDLVNADPKGPPTKYDFSVSLNNPGSSSSFEGLPLLPSDQTDDEMITDLNDVHCITGTTVYITSNLWSYDASDKTRRDGRLMRAVKGLDDAKCKIVVAGAASMNVNSNTFANAEDKGDGTKASELWQAAHYLKSFDQLTASQFRFFNVRGNAPPYVTLHAKLIIVEQPAGNKQGYLNKLFFGSLTMENVAVLNDQVWLSITDPDANTFAFYKRVFNAVFANLSGKPSDIPNSDPTNN